MSQFPAAMIGAGPRAAYAAVNGYFSPTTRRILTVQQPQSTTKNNLGGNANL
jgi:hypothetical protein